MENMTIDEKISELTKLADAAQRSGDYYTMNEYDRQIQELQDKKWEEFKQAVDEEDSKTK
jgi:hypothetical protein